MRWSPLFTLVVVLALALPGSLYVALGDGGPSPAEDGGATTWRPVVEEWRFTSASPSGEGMGAVLCTSEDACDFDALADAATAGMTCALEGTVWLSGGGSGTPFVLKDVDVLLAVIIERGRGDRVGENVVNASHYHAEFPMDWPNGWWWRVESERLHVTTPSPCDARVVKLLLNFESATVLGRDVHLAQTAEVALAPWPGTDA